MRISSRRMYLASILVACVLLSSSAMARKWPWRRAKASAVMQDQEAAPQKPAQVSSEQEPPAQDQPAQDKPETKKPSPDKSEGAGKSATPESQGPSQEEDSRAKAGQAPAEPSQAAKPEPSPGQPSPTTPAASGARPDSDPDANTPQAGTPAEPALGTPGEAPTSSPEKLTASPAPKITNHKHNHVSPSRNKVVVREGSTADAGALLSPSMTREQASSQIQNTTQLLASAETSLQKISPRKLNVDQQAIVDQIHTYMQQAKEALSRGDLQRGHNLALKASLLADDLARH